MNGSDCTTAFIPLDSRIGGQGRNDRPTAETAEMINTGTMEQQMEQENN